MNDARRPDPDLLLSRIEAEEKKLHRGRLKIFFGSSAGVGKTYAMLSAAREKMEQGKNVLAGIVETHGRPETERLLQGIFILPSVEISYRGVPLKELDLDAALTRKPDILLVDELAHTNAPGTRHPKRWNDVMELLDAGIDVYTTLNVQHIESLADLVAGTTGVWVKETVPDTVFDLADDIALVDLDEDDLIKRLHEGKVYVAPGAMANAAQHFFKKNNLSALREIALRRMAERVEAERAAMTPMDGQIPVAENILVCIGLGAISAKLIRSARRMASALKAPWQAIYVDRDAATIPSQNKNRALEALDRMTSRMGGKLVVRHGDSVADEVIAYARSNGVTKIIVGKDVNPSLRNFFNGLMADKIIKESGHIDVFVITGDKTSPSEPAARPALALITLRPFDYLLALVAVTVLSIPGHMMAPILSTTDQALLYLTGSILVAERLGFGPSLFYAFLSAAAFHILFVAHADAHKPTDKFTLITFFVMTLTGAIIAGQASRLRTQALSAREREKRTQDLYALTRKLTATRGRFPVSEVVAHYVSKTLEVDVTVWMTNAEGHPSVILGNLPQETYYKDFGALQWCFENAQNAGRATTTMPSAAGFYLPLTTSTGTLGVLGLFPKTSERVFTHEEVGSMETVASLLASALERVRAGEIAQQIMVEKESARLHGAAAPRPAVSHDFRFPDEYVLETRSAGLNEGHVIDSGTLKDISSALTQQSGFLSHTLRHFFDRAATDATPEQINRRPTSIGDRITHVVKQMADVLGPRKIIVCIQPDLPDVLVDLSLVEQALACILDNVARYTPPETTVTISTERRGSDIVVHLGDNGPGLPEEGRNDLFNRFAPAPKTDGKEGNGVGLAVAAGIVRLHGGDIWAGKSMNGGALISFSLPIA